MEDVAKRVREGHNWLQMTPAWERTSRNQGGKTKGRGEASSPNQRGAFPGWRRRAKGGKTQGRNTSTGSGKETNTVFR